MPRELAAGKEPRSPNGILPDGKNYTVSGSNSEAVCAARQRGCAKKKADDRRSPACTYELSNYHSPRALTLPVTSTRCGASTLADGTWRSTFND